MSPYFICLVALLISKSQAGKVFYNIEDAEHHFEEFIVTFNRQYLSEHEKMVRFNIFKENLMRYNEKNTKSQARYGIDQFSDLTIEEFKQLYTGMLKPSSLGNDCENGDFNLSWLGPAPESLDWRTMGKVTEVKDQGTCGSCWSFSTTGNLEGQYAIKHNKLIEISEQQLVDCDTTDSGCDGGLMPTAMTWLSKNGGAMSEQDYPYKGYPGTCKFNKSKAVVQVSGCKVYPDITEDQLKSILANVGPLAMAVDASSFSGYHGGVHDCDPTTEVNHGVLLVGYGTDETEGKPYWLIKNSWGTTYGEEGYIRLTMYKNSCLLLANISSAAVA